MIDIKFKPCCNTCVDIDLDTKEQSMYTSDGRVVVSLVIIRCEHENVCKAYIECNHIKEDSNE